MRITQNSNYEIIKDLIVIAKGLDLTKENYLISYPHFINYFKNLERISLENMIIGISFTYSWMPTILKSMKLENTEKAIILLNKVKRGKILSVDELLILKETFNNSLVGSSKLLHFINPEKYAIWDSRVYRYLNNGEQPHNYRIEKPKTYLKYLNLIEELKKEKSFNAFYEILKQKVGYVISGNRALELAFFKGKGLKEGKNKNRAIL